MCDRIPPEQISPASKVFVRCCWQGRNGSAAKHAADELLADSPADPSVRNADGMDAEWQRLADAIVEDARQRDSETDRSYLGEPPEQPPRWLADREIELRNADITRRALANEELIRSVAADYEEHASHRDEQEMADWCRARAAQLRTGLANVKEDTDA